MISGWIAATVLLVSADPVPPDRSDALAWYGAGLWQARHDRLLTAIKSFETAAKLDPESNAPLLELIRLYGEIGREPDAIRTAKLVLTKDPTDIDAAHALARLLHQAGDDKEALAYAKIAAGSPAMTERTEKALAVYRDLAKLCDSAGDLAGAERAYRKALELLLTHRRAVRASRYYSSQEIDTETAENWEKLGKVLVKLGKNDSAVEAFRMAFALFDDPAKANDKAAAASLHWNLSGVEMARGDGPAAVSHLEAYLKLQPRAVEPYERYAAALRLALRGGEVAALLQARSDRHPKNLALRAVLASELARNPETRVQADHIFAELSQATNDPDIVRCIVRSHFETGRTALLLAELDEAYKAIKKDDPVETVHRAFAAEKARTIAEVLRAEPECANAVLRTAAEELRQGTKRTDETRYFMAALAARHRKLELAAVQFRQAVRNAHPETEAAAYEGLIGVLWRSRKPAEVAAVCRDGLRTASHTSPVYFNYHLALALAWMGEADEAIVIADKAISQAGDVNRLTVRLRKVQVFEALGRWKEAVDLCRKMLDEFETKTDRLQIRYALAGAYWGAKKGAESEAELRAILEADPDHAGAANDLGYHLADQGRDLEEAERLIRHAIALDRADRKKAGSAEPESAAYLDSLGWLLFRKENLKEAKEWLETSAALPDGIVDPTVWDHLGDVYFRLGDKPRAKAAWESVLTLSDSDTRGKRDGRVEEVKKKLKLVR